MRMIGLLGSTLVLLLAAHSAWAYETVPVEAGATLRGRVLLEGEPQPAEVVRFSKDLAEDDRKHCDAARPLVTPFYVTGPEGGLRNVVVWIEGVQKGKPVERKPGSMVNEGCRFLPHVQSLEVGAKVQIENHDPILHTTHAIYQGRRITAFNVGQPRKGQKAKKKVRRPGLLRVQCDSGHVWMRAWIHVFDHPYHTEVGEDGRFEITDIPPGRYTLKVWHELSGTSERSVELEPGASVEESFTLAAVPLPEGHAEGHHAR